MLQTIIPPPILDQFEHKILYGGDSGDFSIIVFMVVFTYSNCGKS
jgi:hypothetical protein